MITPALFLSLAVARMLDLGTTYLVDPSLKRELNPLIRRLGWPLTIACNLVFISFAPCYNTHFITVAILLSVLAAGYNTLVACLYP